MKNLTGYKKSIERSGRKPSNGAAKNPGESNGQPVKPAKLPPNENIQKLPDEVYGDMKIPKGHR
jgi:uncharacterized surface anchored protein